jgi:outer membrane protein assembly factor BamB
MAPSQRSLQVLLDRNSYTAGETVSGTVELLLKKPLRTRGVRVYLTGSENTSIRVTRGMGRDETTRTYTASRPLTNQGFILFGGDRVGMLKALGETLESVARSLPYPILPAGPHRYPFQFELPDDALPTWSGNHATVAYSLRAEVDVPVGSDLTFNGVLYVVAPESWSIIPVRRVERQLPGGVFSAFQADVSMEFEFKGCPLRWKERLEGKLRIRNRSKKQIRGATISLMASEHAEVGGYARDSTSRVLSGFFKTPDPTSPEHEVTFGFVLDPPLSPFQGAFSRVVYWLEAEVDVKFASDPVIRLPLDRVEASFHLFVGRNRGLPCRGAIPRPSPAPGPLFFREIPPPRAKEPCDRCFRGPGSSAWVMGTGDGKARGCATRPGFLAMRRLLRRITVAFLALPGLMASAGPERPPSATVLGSPDFKPTPERPIGWRGDGTGRFPGATPPTAWSRRVHGITTTLRYQAAKPAGDPSKESRALEYFSVKDWLVTGPIAVQDPAKDIDQDFLGGEAGVQPSEAGKPSKLAPGSWKFLRADVDTQSRHECNEGTCGQSYVDFVYAFGKFTDGPDVRVEGDFTNKVAYAHTYIHSPAEGQVQLQIPFEGTAGKFWWNGKPTGLDPKNRGRIYDVTLVAGWNRLLVKISVANGLGKHYSGRWLSAWMAAAYLTPVGPVSYETRNVAWMTKMTGRSMSQPIVVGERIFVGSGISDLMCLNKKDGRVLWLQSNTPYDALTADPKAASQELREKVEPLWAKLNALNAEVVAAINGAVSPQGLSSTHAEELDRKLKVKSEAERAIQEALSTLDRKKYPPIYRNEVSASNATPCSDGHFVYWVSGGGAAGLGAYVIACFDLEGKRKWTVYDGAIGTMEHGSHASPALVEGKLIYGANKTLLALEAKTGKEVWRNSPNDWTNELYASSPVIASLGGATAIISNKYIHRASDGMAICTDHVSTMFTSALTPIVEGGILYSPGQHQGGEGKPWSFIAVRLPSGVQSGAKAEILWAPDGKEVSTTLRGRNFMIASPLYVEGIVYSVEMSGGLTAIDPMARKCLYRQWLEGYDRYNRMVYGVCASPTLAGKTIYITDDAGYTHLIVPGPHFKEAGRNVLENLHFSGFGGNPCHQESFYTAPYFEGKAMYLRGEEYLYRIEEAQASSAR